MFRFGRIVASFVALAACQANAPTVRDAGLHDDFGTPIAIAEPAKRIVSLNPTTTELLFAIGAGSRLAGRSQYDTFPDSAKLVPDVGPALRPNVEAVLAMHPDLVILYASQDNRGAYDRLRGTGVRTFAFKVDSIAQFQRVTRLLGALTGNVERADRSVDTVTATLDRVRAATSRLPRPTILLHAWDKPIIAIGGGSFMSELLTIAGARNLYADLPGPSAPVTLEDIVRRNPNFILASSASAAKMRASADWRAVPAVRADHFIIYDLDLVTRPSIQLGAAARSLADLIHPGAVR